MDSQWAQDLARLVARDRQDWAAFFDRRGHQVALLRGEAAFARWEPPVRRGLCGIRCIRAKAGGSLGRELVLAQAWRLDSLAVVQAKNGRPAAVVVAYPRADEASSPVYQVVGPVAVEDAAFMDIAAEVERVHRMLDHAPAGSPGNRVLVVSLRMGDEPPWRAEDVANEMVLLARSAGAAAVHSVVVDVREPDAATLVGRGKAQEIEAARREAGADLVAFSYELAPAHVRNLEGIIGGRLLDRTELILDIFAQRARTREGKLQVELAQLNYRLPRLVRARPELDRLGGGIGTRGPGETRLEVDRRRVRERISQLEREIEEVRRTRSLQRAERQSVPYPLVALVGYTNAGKSTLLNALTGASVLTEDRLFATLDPTTRLLELPSGQRVLISDTVGFIRNLPHHLVAAFRATLEEVGVADVLVHVVDAAHPAREEQVRAVEEVLGELGADRTPRLTVYNKIDLLAPGEGQGWNGRSEGAAASALTGEGLDVLLDKLDAFFRNGRQLLELTLAYDEGWAVSWIHQAGRVVGIDYTPESMNVRAEMDGVRAARLLRMLDRRHMGRPPGASQQSRSNRA
ncbi:MAG: GTPase HflX [Bacillota bacterium]|nr:GTPase HflX [Bacillota bacterium]